MKKMIITWICLFLVVMSFFLIAREEEKSETAKIHSELMDNGEVDGTREFVFSLTNTGKKDAILTFPTWLEYNVHVERLTNDEVVLDGITIEHVDLNSNEDGARGVQLPPEQSLTYRIRTHDLPSGHYEMRIGSASDVGGMERLEFTVN